MRETLKNMIALDLLQVEYKIRIFESRVLIHTHVAISNNFIVRGHIANNLSVPSSY